MTRRVCPRSGTIPVPARGRRAGRLPVLSAVLLSALLAGCGGGDQSDLEDYVRKVKARDPGAIEPLPEIKQINTYVYEPAERRDPFVVDARAVDQPAGASGNSLAPDPLRRKEELRGLPWTPCGWSAPWNRIRPSGL